MIGGRYELGELLVVSCDDMAARFPNANHIHCRVDGRTGRCYGLHCNRCGQPTDCQGGHDCPDRPFVPLRDAITERLRLAMFESAEQRDDVVARLLAMHLEMRWGRRHGDADTPADVETVARAMYGAWHDVDARPWEDQADDVRRDYLEAAPVVLAALLATHPGVGVVDATAEMGGGFGPRIRLTADSRTTTVTFSALMRPSPTGGEDEVIEPGEQYVDCWASESMRQFARALLDAADIQDRRGG